MPSINLHYTEIDTDEGFRKFALDSNGEIREDALYFANESYTGKVKRLKVEEGLNVNVWDFTQNNHGLDIDKEPYNNITEKTFSLFFLLTANQVFLENPRFKKEISFDGLKNTPLLSNNTYFTVHANTGQPVKTIDIGMTSSWMIEQLSHTQDSLSSFIDNVTQGNEPVLFLGTCSPDCYSKMNAFHQQALEDKKNILSLRSSVLQVILDFFENSVEKEIASPGEMNRIHHSQVVEAESILTEYLDKNLPPLSIIAQKVAMSESTLRRHFKLVFGKNIYEYYLEKKMDYANRMLLNHRYNVNEVASKLGYEKVSSFINSFKKFYGFSPGSILKNRI